MCAENFKKNSVLMNERAKRLRILIYDPDQGSREFLSEALIKDHEVVSVQPKKGELRVYLDIRGYDILIIDPENEEIKELLHRVCKHYSDEKFWVIVTSDKDEIQLGLKDLREMNQNRLFFVPKPYDLDIIEKTVNQIVQWKKNERQVSKSLTRRLVRFLGIKN